MIHAYPQMKDFVIYHFKDCKMVNKKTAINIIFKILNLKIVFLYVVTLPGLNICSLSFYLLWFMWLLKIYVFKFMWLKNRKFKKIKLYAVSQKR